VNLHEYQARDILRRHGIPVPPGEVASTPAEAKAIAERMGGKVVVKAQVHAGGRGKAGGVKLAKTAGEAETHARAILGMTIKGLTVQKVLIAPTAEIASESYVGIIVDRASQRPVLMVSAAGGIDIEEVAAKTPEKIHRLCRTRRSVSGSRCTRTSRRRAPRPTSCRSCTRPCTPWAPRSRRSIRW